MRTCLTIILACFTCDRPIRRFVSILFDKDESHLWDACSSSEVIRECSDLDEISLALVSFLVTLPHGPKNVRTCSTGSVE
jgi:hypothetical protein